MKKNQQPHYIKIDERTWILSTDDDLERRKKLIEERDKSAASVLNTQNPYQAGVTFRGSKMRY